MIKVRNLLPEDEVLEKSRATVAGAQAVLVWDWAADVAGQGLAVVTDYELAQEVLSRLGFRALLQMLVGIAGNIAACQLSFHVRALRQYTAREESRGEN